MSIKNKVQIGKKYNKLLVLEKFSKPGNFWYCLCDCGKNTVVGGTHLLDGHTKSCGCLKLETKNTKSNKFEILENFTILYTNKNEEIFIDTEDFERVKNYCWYKDKKGYICCHNKNKSMYLHRYLLNANPNDIIDHINNKKYDNQKNNLRIASASINQHNRKNKNANKTGVVGVYYNESGSYSAKIMIDNKDINLGTYNDFDDAVKARLTSEKENFGNYSTQSDLFEKYGI